MAFQLSPGVSVSEIDLTTVVPSVLTTAGAFAGTFTWGPANKVVLVDSEITLAKTFTAGPYIGPDANSATSFFTAASFLAYGNNLSVVRSIGVNSKNARSNTIISPITIANKDVFESSFLSAPNGNNYGPFVGRYPGALGNSIQVDTFDSSNTQFFANATFTSGGVSRNWSSIVSSAPSTSTYVSNAGGANDEFHIVVTDAGGLFTGSKGTILEIYPFTSKAADSTINGSTNYYKQDVFNRSNYIYAIDPVDYSNTSTTWGLGSSTNFSRSFVGNTSIVLSGGSDDVGTDANTITAFSLFTNKEQYDISLVLTGNASIAVQQYAIDNIAVGRGDCVAFVSPPSTAVVNQTGSEKDNITNWLTSLSRSSSFIVADSGWKYMYDKYNNTYRYIPLNADIAGLCVYTDTIRDPWFSPAGFNRGAIKNCIKLAWNPSKTYRDTLYAAGVNPVVSFPGQGTVLFGDKTLQSKPSAFDRINVRRLFITLEKAISQAAKFSLFELNDEITRAQFVNLITPYLRDIKGRRGITDFKVICDTTNNTPNIIDSNQFVGDIYIKPARSINYIQLNFVAVATGVDFNTIVNAA